MRTFWDPSWASLGMSFFLGEPLACEPLPTLRGNPQPFTPRMTTLQLGAGKKQKVRPGDILGALTGEGGIAGDQVGKIALFDHQAYVAVQRDVARKALSRLAEGKIKGRSLRVRLV